MNDKHLSAWEQEEYLLGQGTPQMLRHLAECAPCQASTARLEGGLTLFRAAALNWSDACLSTRPRRLPSAGKRLLALRWAVAGVLPIILLVLALLAVHSPGRPPARPAASISDDALLDQVDDQLSVAVPASMESLTHLVSTESSNRADGSKHLVQTN